MELASITTTDWFLRSTAKTVMSALALAGITGIYLRQRSRVGVVGLVGYVALAVGYLLMFGTEFLAAFVLPTIAETSPGYATDVIVTAFGGSPVGDIGSMSVVLQVTGAGYILGGLIFGVTTFRAGVLAQWAAALLAVANSATVALAVLPDSFNRPFAVPTGIALIGLGVSLWRDQRREQALTATDAAGQEARARGARSTGRAPVSAS